MRHRVLAALTRLAGIAALGAALGGCAFVLPQSEALRTHWPDRLDPQVELSAVPFFPQEDYQCGPAALATVLVFDGVAVTPEALVPKVYLPERHGSLQLEMLAAPRAYGVVSAQLAPRFEDVLREVEAGTPVILLQDYGVWPFRVWHYAVLVGYDRERDEAVLRSGVKERLRMPFRVFEYLWKKSDYWAIVAVRPDRIPVTADEATWSAAVAAMERVAPHAASRTAYRTLLARWPESLNGTIGLANVEYAEGDLTGSEKLLRQAVARHPESTVALNNLAQVLSDQHRHREALQIIDRAVALGGPFQAAAEQTRAQIREKMRDASLRDTVGPRQHPKETP